MKRFAKIILAIVAALAAALVLALIGINLYLQSGEVQQRVRLATEQAIGMPVTVQRTLYTPWSGLTLSGLSLPDPTVPGAHLVNAPRFSVQFEFWPLLQRRFVISSVHLSRPHLALRQTEDRRWVIAPPPPPESPTAFPSPSAEKPPTEKPRASAPAYTVELRAFSVTDGSAEIVDRKGNFVARVEGLQIEGSVAPDRTVHGNLWVERIAFFDQLFPNRLRAQFTQSGDRFVLSDVKAAIAGGKIRGELHVIAPRRGEPTFQTRGEIEDVSLPTLIAEACGGDDGGAAGTLLGRFDLRGNPLDAETLVGKGEFSLDSAQLRPLEFIQQIGAILGVDELQLLRLRQANVQAEVLDERVFLREFTLRTENLAIAGQGPIRFNGKMNLDCRLLLNEKLQRQLGGIIGNNLTPSEDANYKQITFSVTGRVDRPKTDLVKKITGFDVPSVGGILKGLFRMPAPANPPGAETGEPTPTPANN